MTSRPNNNTYWVQEGRLLAGEYPGAANEAQAAIKLEQFLDSGIDYFIDLTEEGELHPYANQLQAIAEQRRKKVVHRRFSIPDESIPASAAQMHDILHCLRQALTEGHVVYVHCYGGIGRTGTVTGCYLQEELGSTEAALKELALLWQQMEKKTRWPATPETSEQLDWIKAWPQSSITKIEK